LEDELAGMPKQFAVASTSQRPRRYVMPSPVLVGRNDDCSVLVDPGVPSDISEAARLWSANACKGVRARSGQNTLASNHIHF
jgi:hypothetical protein